MKDYVIELIGGPLCGYQDYYELEEIPTAIALIFLGRRRFYYWTGRDEDGILYYEYTTE